MLRHPQQLCLWSRRGFASPQSALSSFNLALITYDVSYMTSVIQYAADYKFIAIGV